MCKNEPFEINCLHVLTYRLLYFEIFTGCFNSCLNSQIKYHAIYVQKADGDILVKMKFAE